MPKSARDWYVRRGLKRSTNLPDIMSASYVCARLLMMLSMRSRPPLRLKSVATVTPATGYDSTQPAGLSSVLSGGFFKSLVKPHYK